MIDEDICKEGEKVWASLSGWGWTYSEFKSLLGYLEPDEEVTLKNGKVVTGDLISYWNIDRLAFMHGWVRSYKHFNK